MRADSLASLLASIAPLALATNGPLTLMALLIVLQSEQPLRRGTAFIAGVATVLCLILAVCSVIFPAGVAEASTTDTGFSAVNLGLGVLLVIVAFRSRHRSSRFAVPNNTEPGNASPPVEPQLLNRMHGISQRGAFLAGMGIATMPPAVVAGTAFARSDTTPGSKLLAGFGFVVLSTASLWLPLIGLRAAPKRAGSLLEHLHQWLARNYDDIVFWVLAGLGVLLMAHELAVILG